MERTSIRKDAVLDEPITKARRLRVEHPTPLTRRVNDEIRNRSLVGVGGPVAFFCECSAACFHVLWRDVMEYDALRRTPEALLRRADHAEARGRGPRWP
jgi:hypothetical protein